MRKVDSGTTIKAFNCGDDDLNDFLLNKSKLYAHELLATTFVLESPDRTKAFFSILNDTLNVQENTFASKSAFKRFLKELVTHPKRHLISFPAIKIGRLAVDESAKRLGLGSVIVNYIINYAISQNDKCACKLVIVDAYSQSLGFYEKFDFLYLSDNDRYDDTRQMYINLSSI
ncbi:MAG: GNAT family N-acetyltransferase [Balneolales bacterium]